MKTSDILEKNILAILTIARLAPSVHNTQPWLVHRDSDSLVIKIDSQHQLRDGDPTGRQTTIGLGIFCEALAIAANNFELRLKSLSLEHSVTRLVFVASPVSRATPEQTKLLKTRSSDRSIYKPTAIDRTVVSKLEACSTKNKTTVIVSTDATIRMLVADLTGKAINVALSSPGFRNELSQYLVIKGSRKQRGIAVGSLYINPLIAQLQPFMLRHGINIGAEAKLEKLRWESASGLVLIIAPGDVPKYWIEAGRSYLRASLEIEAAGLSQATSAGIVEASNYHEDIEEALHTGERLLAVIRIGKGSPERRYSPRVLAAALLTEST